MAVTPATLQASAADRADAADRVDQLTRDLVAAWAAAWTASETQIAVGLSTLIAGAARWPTRRQILTSYQMQAALAVVQASTARLTGRAHNQAAAAAAAAAASAAAAQAAIIASQLPAGVSLAAGVAMVSDAQLTAITHRASDTIGLAMQALPGAVAAAVRGEVIRGRRDTDLRRAALAVLRDTERYSSAALSRALLIIRTELMDAQRAAAQAAQAAAADVLAGWMWVSELSPTTCPSCWAMHGTIHPLTEPGPLDHPAGRCRRLPVLRPWADLGLPGPEPADVTPDAQTVFRALPRADQLRVMGPGRLHLLDTGQATWAGLARRRDNPGWRPAYTATPIRDLT